MKIFITFYSRIFIRFKNMLKYQNNIRNENVYKNIVK